MRDTLGNPLSCFENQDDENSYLYLHPDYANKIFSNPFSPKGFGIVPLNYTATNYDL
jgi:hypothetical protein